MPPKRGDKVRDEFARACLRSYNLFKVILQADGMLNKCKRNALQFIVCREHVAMRYATSHPTTALHIGVTSEVHSLSGMNQKQVQVYTVYRTHKTTSHAHIDHQPQSHTSAAIKTHRSNTTVLQTHTVALRHRHTSCGCNCRKRCRSWNRR